MAALSRWQRPTSSGTSRSSSIASSQSGPSLPCIAAIVSLRPTRRPCPRPSQRIGGKRDERVLLLRRRTCSMSGTAGLGLLEMIRWSADAGKNAALGLPVQRAAVRPASSRRSVEVPEERQEIVDSAHDRSDRLLGRRIVRFERKFGANVGCRTRTRRLNTRASRNVTHHHQCPHTRSSANDAPRAQQAAAPAPGLDSQEPLTPRNPR
jgi:hypothetical protein